MKQYDIAVIGSGPGGYVCAIRAAQLGFSVALVEKYDTLGGTCLNVGCIPSKALLDVSHRFEDFSRSDQYGISVWGAVSPDIQQMMTHKKNIITQTCQGIEFLMKKNKVEVLHGVGKFLNANELEVSSEEGTQKIQMRYAVIATGSKPVVPSFASVDKERIITSTEALSLTEIPQHFIIIGGGVIGLEIGQVYHRLGAKVSVIEYAEQILPTMDASLGKELTKSLKKQGIEIHTKTQVTQVVREGNSVKVFAQKGEEMLNLQGDYCMICVGRKPFTQGLGLENVGIITNEKGQIVTNERLQTSVENIFAIGDVVQGAMLAHKAEEEGVFVAETIAGQKPHINYNLIPAAVYTSPEIASVGQTEQQLKTNEKPYKVGQFPMKALGRARAGSETEGFVKILADEQTDEILGVHIIGARASDLIAQAVTAMEFRASAEDIARICHAHPTFSEAMKEAALDCDKRAIHI